MVNLIFSYIQWAFWFVERAIVTDCLSTIFRLLASKKKKKKKPKKKKPATVTQSDPPRVGLSKLFPTGTYPEGEIQEYKNEYVDLQALPLFTL